MANVPAKEDDETALWNDRPVVTLNERFGRERLLHAVVIAPAGMNYQEAMRRIDEVFREAVVADPEDWIYEDVLERLVTVRFEVVRPAEWWEHKVEMSDD